MAADMLTKASVRIVKTTSAISETTLIFNPWLISPTRFKHSELSHLDSRVCAVVYAISEPLLTQSLVYLAVPPWILLLCIAGSHCQNTTFFTIAQGAQLNNVLAAITSTGSVDKGGIEPSRKASWLRKTGDASHEMALATFCVQIMTTAASNAALLLLAHSLDHLPSETGFLFSLGLPMFAFVISLVSHITDHSLCESTGRAMYVGQRGWREARVQLTNLSLLLILRTALRALLGTAAFGWLETFTDEEWQQRFGEARYLPFKESVPTIPPWLIHLLNALSIVLSLAGSWHLVRKRAAEAAVENVGKGDDGSNV